MRPWIKRRWHFRRAIVPVEVIAPERQQSLPGAYTPPELLRGEDDPSLGRYPVPDPFDWSAIITLPKASPVTLVLIGVPGTFNVPALSRAVPRGRRGVVLAILPYVEFAAGGIVPPGRIDGATFNWAVGINGRPAGDYGGVTTILGAWNDPVSIVPLLELGEGDALTVVATITDPAGLFGQVGIRVRGQFLACSTDDTVHADAKRRQGFG